MDLSTIIGDADGLVANSYTNAQKVRWLNQIRRRLQRNVKFPDAIDRQAVVQDVALYTLPTDCQPDRIERVVVVDASNQTQTEYTLVGADESLRNYVASVTVQNKLWLYPAPTVTGDLLWVYYSPSETDWTDSDLTVEPSTPPADYHEYYIFRLAERIAKERKDVDLANNLAADAKEVLLEMRREFDSDGVIGFQMDMNW